jgi:PIN domain nuclease of toxin-antitoxin system
VYLGENEAQKRYVPHKILLNVLAVLELQQESYKLAMLDEKVLLALTQIPRESVPDMPDRIITATARAKRVPLITKDEKITCCGEVRTIWD